MKSGNLTATFIMLALTQTACLTTVETRPFPEVYEHDHHHVNCQHVYHEHSSYHPRTVRVVHPRRVYVPVYRPARTTVTVRRY